MPHEQLSPSDQHLYGDQWHGITDSPAAKRRAKAQAQIEKEGPSVEAEVEA